MVFDKSAARGEEVAGQHPGRAIAVAGDVRSLEDHRRAVGAALARFGRLDVFVGNAGIWDFNQSLYRTTDEQLGTAFDEIFAVNVKGCLLGAKAALEPLVESEGCMIFTISNAGFFPDGGGALYTMSKHALVGLVRQLAYELAPRVRVNGVAPGPMPTDIRGADALGLAERSMADVLPAVTELAEQHLPRMHMPLADEYAGAYVFLASRANSNMATGTILNVDGGFAVRGSRRAAGGTTLQERIGARRT